MLNTKINSPLEAFETFSAVIVVVAISLTAFILIFVVFIVKCFEDPREQWQIGLAGTSMEKWSGIDVSTIALLLRRGIRGNATFGVEIFLFLHLVDEAAEGRTLGDRKDGSECEKG